jgi:hypothetical protein
MQKNNLFNGEDASKKSRQLINKNGQKSSPAVFGGDQMAPFGPSTYWPWCWKQTGISLAGTAEFERGDYVFSRRGAPTPAMPRSPASYS